MIGHSTTAQPSSGASDAVEATMPLPAIQETSIPSRADDQYLGALGDIRCLWAAEDFATGPPVGCTLSVKPESGDGDRLELLEDVSRLWVHGDHVRPSPELTYDQARYLVESTRQDRLTYTEQQVLRRLLKSQTPLPGDARDGDALTKLLMKTMREKFSITEAETDAIDNYQGCGYKDLNRCLREERVQELLSYKTLIRDLCSAIHKLPKTHADGLVRCVSFASREEVVRYLEPMRTEGATFVSRQFESVRRGGSAAKLPSNHPFIVTLRIESGARAAEISSVGRTYKQSEHESLYPPGVQFVVLRRPDFPDDRNDYASQKPFHTNVWLKELPELGVVPVLEDLLTMPAAVFAKKALLGSETSRRPLSRRHS